MGSGTMSVFPEHAHAVRDALNDLREVSHYSERRENAGFKWDPKFSGSWSAFKQALLACSDVIKNPQPGQGLCCIWLRIVRDKAIESETAAREYSGGWHDVLWHDNDSFLWLVDRGWESGWQIARFRNNEENALESLLDSTTHPRQYLQQLAGVAEAGETASLNAECVGKLILHAVDAVELHKCWFEDSTFCKCILNNLDMPAGVMSDFTSKFSVAELKELVRQLEYGRNVNPIPEEQPHHPGSIDIAALEKISPPLDRGNGLWVSNRKAAELESLESETLGKYRRNGQSTADGKFGRDIHGRIWRREGNPSSHPCYLRRTLLSKG
jgi:hypothetical protein